MVSFGRVAEWGLQQSLILAEKAVEKIWPNPIERDLVKGGLKEIEKDLARHVEPEPPAESAPPEPVTQWGLKVPNGNIVWDNALYCGNPLVTPEHRTAVAEALLKTAHELGFAPEEFLKDFGWVRRVGLPGVVWGEAAMVPLIEQQRGPELNGHAVGSADNEGIHVTS